MTRHNFTAKTKKAALEAAGGVCQARGALYGMEPETACTVILVAGNVEYDHYPLPAHAEGSDTVENCMPLCKEHHAFKTRHYDIPTEARIKRLRKKHGLDPITRKAGRKMQSRKFGKGGGRKLRSRSFGQ